MLLHKSFVINTLGFWKDQGEAIILWKNYISLHFLLRSLPADASLFRRRKVVRIAPPPKESYYDTNHGRFIFIYPKVIPDSYSGCQTYWDERGARIIVYHFKDGKPTYMKGYNGGQLVFSCKIKDEEGIQNENGFACPSLESVSFSLQLLRNAKQEDYMVPPERDPRR